MTTIAADPQMAGMKSRKRRTTEADWEEHKPSLYIDEKKSRKEVREIMREQEHLDITEKQLKYWFETKWKIAKNKRQKSRGMLQQTSEASTTVRHLQTELSTMRTETNKAVSLPQPQVGMDIATNGFGVENALDAFGGRSSLSDIFNPPLPDLEPPLITPGLEQQTEESYSDIFDYNMTASTPSVALQELSSHGRVQSQELLLPRELQ
ncbi:Clr5 domain-containing protein [Cladophialophora immunda]|nr:Clr5 domain-containing protein [Cladophialophora immunda]